MDLTFNGTPDEFDHVVRGGRISEVIESLAQLKEMSHMEAVELGQLKELTDTLAATVEDVVKADQAEDAAFNATIDQLKADVASGKLTNEQLQTELDALKAGVGEVNPKIAAVIAALKATGTDPANPLPEPPTV